MKKLVISGDYGVKSCGMHSIILAKGINKTESNRTFVPKKIGETLSKVNKRYSNKFGKNEFLIISKWPQIVGTFFADHSVPDRISKITEEFNELDEPIFKMSCSTSSFKILFSLPIKLLSEDISVIISLFLCFLDNLTF